MRKVRKNSASYVKFWILDLITGCYEIIRGYQVNWCEREKKVRYAINESDMCHLEVNSYF